MSQRTSQPQRLPSLRLVSNTRDRSKPESRNGAGVNSSSKAVQPSLLDISRNGSSPPGNPIPISFMQPLPWLGGVEHRPSSFLARKLEPMKRRARAAHTPFFFVVFVIVAALITFCVK